jgi:alpha-1,3-rhamnosyl/mannosyltransferase
VDAGRGELKVILSIDSVKYPLTGIGRYTCELAKQLVQHADIERVQFMRGVRLVDSLPAISSVSSTMNGVRSRLLKSRLAVSLYQLTVPRMKKRTLRGFEDHVFHGPNFYLPSFNGSSLATLHDLSPFLWADCHPPERVRYMRSEIEHSLRRASMLITDSEFTRQEVAAYFGWPIEKIRAVPLASEGGFYPRSPELLQRLLYKYALVDGGYSLFLGTIEPRKNLKVLLDAYESLPVSLRKRWPLILAGYSGWHSEAIFSRIDEGLRSGWVRYLGYLPPDDLPLLMAGARLFVFPSLYEGFGLPVLEAMASGIPVVCSNSSSLPEVAGDAALMFDPADVNALGQLILKGLEDENWRASARKLGIARAAQFSWSRCARETVDAYRLVQR